MSRISKDPVTTSEEYVAYVLEGAKAAYDMMPESLRRGTLEAYQAHELRTRGLEELMTLTKAIEAARYYLKRIKLNDTSEGDYSELWADNALAALPDKPMTEVQIFDLIDDASGITLEGETILNIIKSLKAANVLYVEEEQ